MELFDSEVRSRQKIGKRYTDMFNKSGFKSTPIICNGNTSVYAQYTIQVENRNEIVNKLKSKNIPTSIHYPSLLSDHEGSNSRKFSLKKYISKITNNEIFLSKSLNNAQIISKKVLSLPMHPNLKHRDQDSIINAVLDALDSIN